MGLSFLFSLLCSYLFTLEKFGHVMARFVDNHLLLFYGGVGRCMVKVWFVGVLSVGFWVGC